MVYNIVNRNYAYYNRAYSLADDDAVNLRNYTNGWTDPTLVTAHTNNPLIYGGISYLLPLEIILRTPLEEWNPLNIEKHLVVVVHIYVMLVVYG